MSRRPATITQADIARAIRAAKQEGAREVEVRVGDKVAIVSDSGRRPQGAILALKRAGRLFCDSGHAQATPALPPPREHAAREIRLVRANRQGPARPVAILIRHAGVCGRVPGRSHPQAVLETGIAGQRNAGVADRALPRDAGMGSAERGDTPPA